MKSVEASAATREDAIQKGLEELGLEMYEVDKIEIIDEGSKGFLGFGARPVKVRLVVEGMEDAPAAAKEDRGGPERGRRGGRGNKPGGQEQGARDAKARDGKERDGKGRDAKGRDAKPRDSKGRDAKARDGKPRGGEDKKEDGREERGEGKGKRGRRRGRRGGKREQRPEQAAEGTAKKEDAKPRQERGRGPRRDDRDKQEKPEAQPVEAAKDEATAAPEPATMEAPRKVADEDAAIVSISDEQGAEAAALLKEIIAKMGIESEVVFVRGDDGSARLDVASEDGAILIGRKGRNLNSMQYLVNRLISQNDAAENTERLLVDVEGYVDRRRATLQDMARSFARKVKDSGRSMRLKPLSPQERRIIHLTLQDDPDVRTYSLGESLFRSVVVSPANGEDEEPRRERGGRRGGGRGERRDRDDRSDRGERRDRDEAPVQSSVTAAIERTEKAPKKKKPGDPAARKRGFGRYNFEDDIDVGTFGD